MAMGGVIFSYISKLSAMRTTREIVQVVDCSLFLDT